MKIKLRLEAEIAEREIKEKGVVINSFLADTTFQGWSSTEDILRAIKEITPEIIFGGVTETIQKTLSVDYTLKSTIATIESISVTVPATPRPQINLRKIEPITLGKLMKTVPFTLKFLPLLPPKAHFYYFTDEIYRKEDSRYRKLDEALTLLASYRGDLDVTILIRSRFLPDVWDMIVRKLGIEKYPTLIVSSESLKIEDIDITNPNYTPPTVNVVKIEAGLILDRILQDRDELFKFLEELHEAAKEGVAEETMRKRKIKEYLKIAEEKLENLISLIRS